MVNMLERLDNSLFYVINNTRLPVLDALMPWFSDLGPFIPVVIAVLIFRFTRGGKRERLFWAFMIAGILMTDFLCGKVLKPLISRPRPYLTLDHVYILKHGVFKVVNAREAIKAWHMSLSFPSCHVSNSTFFSVFLALEYRRAIPFTALLVALVGYSRIYLGAHYPLDCAGGLVVGALVAIFMRWIFRRFPASL